MARTKKLTDPIYSPTNPTSEAAIRAQIDDSIQEVYDQSSRNDETVNLTGNQTVAGIKTFSSSPIVPTPTTSTQVANKAYVDGVAISATIPLDSLTDEYLASAPGNIKPRVATAESEIDTLQNDVNALETIVDIARTAKTATGLVNSLVVDTAGAFDLTLNGNILTIIPNLTNTSTTVTLAVDGQTAKAIKKADDSGTYVNVAVGDIKKSAPTQLVWDSVNDFFVLAPKGGAFIKSIQRGTVTMTGTTTSVTITSVDTTKSIVKITTTITGTDQTSLVTADLQNSTTLRLRCGSTVGAVVDYEVIEFENVKSLQKGDLSVTVTNANKDAINQVITSVDLSKTILFFSVRSTNASTSFALAHYRGKIDTSTAIRFAARWLGTDYSITINWQAIEFN